MDDGAARSSNSDPSVNPEPARMLEGITFPPHVAKRIAAGELWRAKECLQGRLRGGKLDLAACEQLGAVLLVMGDVKWAGQLLLLSGSQRAEFRPVIEAYLERSGERPWTELVAHFPRAARHTPLEELPIAVRDLLKRRGLPDRQSSSTLAGIIESIEEAPGDTMSPATWALILSTVGLLAITLLFGIYQLGQLVWGLF